MKIISHRASHVTQYKPNTKEAILGALSNPYIDGVEFDVRLTKDKKIVILHDPIINFVSDGSGMVKNLSYRKLLQYNFGSKTIPQKISTLSSVLKSVYNHKILLIEIKEETDDLEIVRRIVPILKKYAYLNIYICSFNKKIIKAMHALGFYCGLIIGYGLNHKDLINPFDFNIVTYSYRNKVEPKETFLWTINERKEDLNQYYIITDKPTLFYPSKAVSPFVK